MKAAETLQVLRPRISPRVFRVFAAYCRRYVRKHFHSFRILKTGEPKFDVGRPVVVYLNHPAWWDPLICLSLSQRYFPNRSSFAPIEANMLKCYGFFKHLGFFPVQPESGALQFLRTSRVVLDPEEKNALWLTPQGRFTDVRERPLQLRRGLGALAVREPHAVFVPLAIEYAYWTESRPEILVTFGDAIRPANETARSAAEWTQVFTDSLQRAQDTLASHSCRRSAEDWQILNEGRSGTTAIYDTWRWLRARLRGENFSPEHHAGARQ
jgi:1-acyl-sn-glycerol-3-phosphate acyltransferase